jgi:hypothetical protein
VLANRAPDLPPNRGHGWEDVAATVAAARSSARGSAGATWVAANRYQDAAELALFLADHPPVFSLNLGGRANQYDLWPGFPQRASVGDHLLLVLEDGDATAEQLAAHFTRVRAGDVVEQRAAGHVLARHRLWVLEDWRGSLPRRPAP